MLRSLRVGRSPPNQMPNNNPKGNPRFQKGQSGNPGGRPKAQHRIKELALAASEEELQILQEIARTGESEAARVAACNAILDRGLGKPVQAVTGEGGGPILLSLMTDDELTKLEQLLLSAESRSDAGDGPA